MTRNGIAGNLFGGTLTITDSELKDILGFAVMDIDVHVQNLLTGFGEHYTGQGYIVHIAETGCPLRPGVVQTAGRIKGNVGLAGENHLSAFQ